MPRSRRRPPAAGGLTLVETLVSLAILGVVAAVAMPSLRALIERKRLEGIAQELVTDLRLIKAQQIQNRPITGTAIRFASTDTKTCYSLYVRGDNFFDCRCELAPELACGTAVAGSVQPMLIRQVDIPRSVGITLAASTQRLVMDGYNGMPRSANTTRVTLTSEQAGVLVVWTNPVGMPSMCSASGSFGSIKPCD